MRTRLPFLCAMFGAMLAFPSAPAQPPAAQPGQPAKPAGLALVPTDSFAFFTVNAGKLWDNPNFKPLQEWFEAQKIGPSDELFGLPTAEIDRITVCLTSFENRTSFLLVTTKKPYNEARLIKALSVELDDERDRRRQEHLSYQ